MAESEIKRRKHTTTNRTKRIQIRVTTWERAMLQQMAARMGMSVGGYLVWAGLPPSCREDAQLNKDEEQAPPV